VAVHLPAARAAFEAQRQTLQRAQSLRQQQPQEPSL
jgi:hypothetical protein